VEHSRERLGGRAAIQHARVTALSWTYVLG
jgi:hypothetical protein